MKKNTLCIVVYTMLLVSLLGWSRPCVAQSTTVISTDWTGVTPSTAASATSGSDDNTVFLYNVGKQLWLGRGGRWGTEAVLSEVAQEFLISGSDTDGYQLESTFKLHVDGSSSSTTTGHLAMCNGVNSVHDWYNYYLDRSDASCATLKFVQVSSGSNIYQITINNPTATQYTVGSATQKTFAAGDYYIVASHNTASSDADNLADYINAFLKENLPSDESDQWILVSKTEYKEKFTNADASTAKPAPGTFLMHDYDFSRNDLAISKWKIADGSSLINGEYSDGTYQHSPSDAYSTGSGYTYYVGNGNPADNSQMTTGGQWTANIHGSNGKVYQTLNGIFRAGWYQVRCHAITTGSKGTSKLFASVGDATTKTTKRTEYAEDDVLMVSSRPNTYIEAYNEVNRAEIIDDKESYPNTSSVLVYVEEKNSTMQTLTFGIKVEGADADAWTSFDNFQIYYLGTSPNEVILDEERTSIDYMNTQNTDDARKEKSTIYLHRNLNEGKWNSLVLPISLNENQIQSVFGAGTIVSAFKGAINQDHPSRMYFEETKTIEAGKLYIIKPAKGEDKGQAEVSATADPDNIKLTGSYYTIPQVSYGQTDAFTAQVSGESGYETVGGAHVQFAGTYINHDKTAYIPSNSYVLKGGSSETAGLWFYRTAETKTKGFRGWLQALSASQAKAIDFSINGIVDGTTAIDGIKVSNMASSSVRSGVYNLNGQRVSENADHVDSLPKGIYIVNGKKVFVK